MYVVTYKIIRSGKIVKKLHIGDHSVGMKNSSWQKLISHVKDNNWERFRPKVKIFKVVIVNRETGKFFGEKIINVDNKNQYGFVSDDIFFNKKEQKFCIGNNLDKCYSMKDYTCKYAKIACRLRKK